MADTCYNQVRPVWNQGLVDVRRTRAGSGWVNLVGTTVDGDKIWWWIPQERESDHQPETRLNSLKAEPLLLALVHFVTDPVPTTQLKRNESASNIFVSDRNEAR